MRGSHLGNAAPAMFDKAPGRPARPPAPAAAPKAAAGLRPPNEERSAETRSDEPGVAARERRECTQTIGVAY